MTRLMLSVFVILMGLTGAAWAEPIPVRSGAHDGFSRLVIHLPRRVPWSINSVDQTRQVEFEAQSLTFDIRDIFERIERTHITDVSQATGKPVLNISLGCACEVDAFWAGTSMLVIDVRGNADGEVAARPVQSGTRVSERLDQATPTDASTTLPFETALALPRRATLPSAVDMIVHGFNRRQEQPSDIRDDMVVVHASEGGAEVVVNTGDIHASLARQIGRAASQGLLTVDVAPPSRSAEEGANAMVDTRDREDATGVEGPAKMRPGKSTNILIGTSLNRDVAEGDHTLPVTMNGVQCIADAELDLGDWASDRAFSAQVAPLRAGLSAEFDHLHQETAMRLARLYLHFGFGAEARQVLQFANGETGLAPDDEAPAVADGHSHVDRANVAVLMALADIMDDGLALRGSVLHGQLDCDGAAAFWSGMAHPDIPSGVALNGDATLMTFSALPRHLRDYLGPILARRLLAGGHQSIADRIFNILERDAYPGTDAERLARAESDLLAGTEAVADHGLADVVEGNTVLAAEALLRRIDTRLRSGRGIPEDMAELAGAYAVEHRDLPIGEEMTRAYVVAIAAAGNFEQAFDEYRRLQSDLGGAVKGRLQNRLYELLTETAADVTFLRYGLDGLEQRSIRLDGMVSNAMAARFLELGFPDIAARVVTGQADGQVRKARRLLRARIELARGRPRSAEVELLGLEGADVLGLRAEARSMSGQHEAAQTLFLAAGDNQAAAREAARSNRWADVARLAEEDVAQVAMLLEEEPDAAAPSAEASLAGARALLEASGRSRQQVEDLLGHRELPVE